MDVINLSHGPIFQNILRALAGLIALKNIFLVIKFNNCFNQKLYLVKN